MPTPLVSHELGELDSRLDDTLVGMAARAVTEDTEPGQYLPGSKVGRYVVLDQVGRGGMGVVLAAFDPQLNRKIALKLMQTQPNRGGSRSSGSANARLLREAQAIAKLSHPNVISVYDVGTIGEGGIYVAMEFIEGCTLTGWLATERRTPQQIVDVFLQAGRGLAAAHAAGLVHRDFKPDNVLVGIVDGQVRVSDFGLARIDPSQVGDEGPPEDDLHRVQSHPLSSLDDSDVLSSQLTQTGVVVGTPRYMAPEQHAGAPADARSDQFAFCVALYQALYRQEPFVAHTMERLAMAKQEGRVCPIPPGARVPDYLEDVVMRGLSPEPVHRFASMEDLVAALERDPAVWRNRLALSVVGIAVATSVVVGFGFTPDEDRSLCRRAGDPWQDVWDPARKAALESMLVAADPAAGARSARAIGEEIDRFVLDWQHVHAEACVAAEGRGDAAAPVGLLELRLRCLERRRDRVKATLEVVDELQPELAPRAARIVTALPGLEPCQSDEFVLAQASLPRDPAVRSGVADLRTRLDRVPALRELGRFDAALELGKSLLDAAEATGDAAFRAEVLLEHGLTLAARGDDRGAEAALVQAVWTATRSRHDEYATLAATALVALVGDRLSRPAEAARWEEHARSLLDRLGLEGLAVADVDNAASRLALRRGDVARARTFAERAAAVRETIRGANDPALAGWLVDLADVVERDGDVDAAAQGYARALELAGERLDADHPVRGEARVGLARVAFDRGRLDEAVAALEVAVPNLERNYGADHVRVADALVLWARVDEANGELASARTRLQAALARYERSLGAGHPAHAAATVRLATVERKLGELTDARAHVLAAIEILRQLDPQGAVLPAERELAELELQSGQSELAIAAFTRLVERLDASPGHDVHVFAEARFGLARALWARDRDPRAHAELERARAALTGEAPRTRSLLEEIERWSAVALKD